MKKIISFILSIALILQGVAVVSAVGISDEREIAEAIRLVEYLEIIDVTSGEANPVTRADFAVYVARIMNFDEYLVTDKTYYNDIPTTHWAAACINMLVECSALTVGEDRMFRPTDEITIQEGVKILLTVMGYRESAEIAGGYPHGYMQAASKLEILENLPQTGTLNRKTAAILLSNALNTNICVAVPDGNRLKYTQDEDETLLSMYKNMYSVEGRVDAVNETALYSGDELYKGIMIDGIVYDYKGDSEYIGLEVMAYYKKDADSDEVVLIFDRTDEDDVIDISAELLDEFTEDYELRYYKNATSSKKTSVRVAKNAAVVYNCMAADTDIVELINIDEGSIRVIRSEGSSVFDTVIVRESETVVAGYVDMSMQKVYDSADGNNIIDLSEDSKTVRIYDSNKNPVSFSAIKKNTVLSVYQSMGKVVEVYISNNEISGEYAGEYEEDGKNYFNIDEKSYRVNSKYYSIIKKKISTGQNVSFKLDMSGAIVAINTDNVDSDFTYGYYLGHRYGYDDEEEVYIKMYSADDGIKTYRVAEKVLIDGQLKKDRKDIEAKLADSIEKANTIYKTFTNRPAGVTSRVVRFKADEDGKITAIDTPHRGDDEPENTLKIVSAGTMVDYIWTGIIGYTTVFNQSTMLFQVPIDSEIEQADDKMFYSGPMKSLGSNINVIGYSASGNNGACDVVVNISVVDNVPGVANNIMVESFRKAIDENGEPTEYLIGWSAGKQVRYIVSSDVKDNSGNNIMPSQSGIENGDIVIMALNSKGEIEQYALVYDCSEDKTYPVRGKSIFPKDYYGTSEYKSYYNSGNRLSYGYAKSLHNGVLTLSYEKGGDNREMYPVNNITVTVCDSSLRKDNIYKGTMDDIITYEDAGEHCSIVIAHSQYVEWKSYYVYK